MKKFNNAKKKNFKSYLKIGIFLAGISNLLIFCEKENEIITEKDSIIKNESNELLMKPILKEDINKNNKLKEKLDKLTRKLKTNKSTKISNKNVQIEGYDFTIDTNYANFVERGNYNSYTFPTVQGRNESLRNVIFSLNENNEYDAYLVSYDYTFNDLKKLNPEELSNRTKMKRINIEFDTVLSKLRSDWVCVYSYEYVKTGTRFTTGASNLIEDIYSWVLTASSCHSITYYDDEIENTYISSSSSNTTSGNITTGGGGSGGIITSPTITPHDELELAKINSLKTELNLNLKEYDWLIDIANYDRSIAIYNYCENNNFSIGSKNFAREAIIALMRGDLIDLEEMYIETNTPDDEYIHMDEKQLIPNPLTLPNGDKVSLQFGITKSDSKNANQEVSIELIEGIKFAIEQANLKLPILEKITSIYIMATTNGKHSPTSNHSNGTAIDISRINGIKMSQSGITNQITELQKGFDGFIYIRENFGPAFKHKYYISNGAWDLNYNIGGHKDHVHISIRK